MPKQEKYYSIGDGYGFHCVLCGLENNFVNAEFDEHGCKECGHITYLKPAPWEEQN